MRRSVVRRVWWDGEAIVGSVAGTRRRRATRDRKGEEDGNRGKEKEGWDEGRDDGERQAVLYSAGGVQVVEWVYVRPSPELTQRACGLRNPAHGGDAVCQVLQEKEGTGQGCV